MSACSKAVDVWFNAFGARQNRLAPKTLEQVDYNMCACESLEIEHAIKTCFNVRKYYLKK